LTPSAKRLLQHYLPEADIATALSERQRSPGQYVDGGSSPDIVSIPSGQIRNLLVEYVRIGTECPSWIWSEMIMRPSSSFVAPSAIAILSTALLCSLSGTAMSQTATGAATPLPSITVVAPKQVARPHRPAQAATVASRPTAPTAQTSSASPEAIIAGPGSTLGKLAKLEKASSSCNGGCETSFKSGNAPWVGCSEAAGLFHTFSATCRDTLTYASYVGCMDTKRFLGLERNKAWWFCSSLQAGGKFKVAELKRSRR
jgi:hypothetical protein